MDGAPSDIRRGEVHLRAVGAWEQEGRLHLQYMVQLERSRRLSHLRTAICNRSHWEPVYGSNLQAKAYCTKEATRVSGPWEYGCLSCVGKRRGLEEAIECVKGGVPLHVVAAEFSMAWVFSWQGTNVLRQQLKLDQDRRPSGPRARRSGCYGGLPGRGRAASWQPDGPTPSGRRRSPSGGTGTAATRPWSLTTSRTTVCPRGPAAPP